MHTPQTQEPPVISVLIPAYDEEGLIAKTIDNQIAKARNTAARNARGEWFIFLDADTLVTHGLLKETIGCIQSGTISAGGAVLRLDSDKNAKCAVYGTTGRLKVMIPGPTAD